MSKTLFRKGTAIFTEIKEEPMKYRKYAAQIRICVSCLTAAVFLLIFSGLASRLAVVLKLQAAPVFMRMLSGFSLGAAAMTLFLLLSAFAAGRFYCASFCPLGLLQDAAAYLSRRKSKKEKDLYMLRLFAAGTVYSLLVFGFHNGFLLLDPYSVSGRILYPFTAGGAAALLGIVLLAVWKKRFFCTSLCPVGTLLGVFAKHGARQLVIGENCIRCGKCVKNCPSGCIDIGSGHIDNGRCVRCLNCYSLCPVQSIRWGKAAAPSDSSRRRFLRAAAGFVSGAAAGVVLAKTGVLAAARKLRILPPGAGNERRFSKKCTACMLCAANCPQKIIVPSRGGLGVELDLTRGACSYNCSRCSNICPTGALTPLPLALKRRTKIAEARFYPVNCIAFQDGEKCGKCAAACPTGAITLRKNGTPRPVKQALCIGCGACQKVCPASPKAMKISAIEQQSTTDVTENKK